MTKKERRSFSRFPFHKQAVLVFSMNYCDVILNDISANGALVETIRSRELASETKCELRVLGAPGRQLFSVDATVVRHTEDGNIGLALNNISPSAEEALQQLVEMNLGSQNLFERDLRKLLSR